MGGWCSAPCSASLQSNCLFPRRLSKKDDIYQSLLSGGDLGGREKGRVYCLWKQAQKMKKTCREGNAFKPQSCQNNYGKMVLGLGIANRCSVHSPLSTSASSPARSHNFHFNSKLKILHPDTDHQDGVRTWGQCQSRNFHTGQAKRLCRLVESGSWGGGLDDLS